MCRARVMSQLINQSIGASRRLCGSILAPPRPVLMKYIMRIEPLGATGVMAAIGGEASASQGTVYVLAHRLID